MMKGRLIFDLTKTQPINDIIYHGGGIYGIKVLKRLIEISPESIAVYYDSSRKVDLELMEIIIEKKIIVYDSSHIPIEKAAGKEAGIIYSPIFNANLRSTGNITVISTIHDLRDTVVMSDKYEASLYTCKNWKSRCLISCGLSLLYRYLSTKKRLYKNKKHNKCLAQSNNRFVTVSETSKYTLLSKIPSLKNLDIKVLYSPDTINYDYFISDHSNPYGKYYLLTSANRWIKNPIRAIIALDELFSERRDIEGRVVVTGIDSRSKLRIKIKNIDRFIFKGYVSDKDMKLLYHYAYLYIYPTLYEGFGYPPLEAMYEGVPVIASGCSSIPEICGDSVLYFNPYIIDEIKIRILQMEDASLRNTYIEKGRARQKEIALRQKRDLDELCTYILSFLNMK